jgi:lactate permease
MTALTLVPTAFKPDISPVADSLAISALVALLPLITVFLTLGVLRWKAHWAGLTSVAVAIVVASLFFGMPLGARRCSRRPRARRSACSRSCGSSSRRSCSTR